MKRFAKGICTIALATSLTTSAFGAEAPNCEKTNASIPDKSNQVEFVISKEMNTPVTHKSDTKNHANIQKEKWEKLSDIQKEEIYRLNDITIDVECQIIEKYMEYGIIDKEIGTKIKAKKLEIKNEMRKRGKIPGHHEKLNRDNKNN